MSNLKNLSPGRQIAYAMGQFGWSIIINIVSLQLVYFYIPPENAGLPIFISQAVFFVVLNTITLIAASGRLLDAVTDPLIANISDRWKGKNGRRIPFLKAGSIPAALFCLLIFVPVVQQESFTNIIWLFFMQALFYVFLTMYVTPFFALLPELGHTAAQRLNLSTWISITYALGIMAASQVTTVSSLISSIAGITDKVLSLQLSIAAFCVLAVILMFIPVIFINENEYCDSKPSDVPLFQAIEKTFKNKSFIFYVTADFSYFMGLTIIMTGLLYYITVLLGLQDTLMGSLLPLMIIISFVFYPLVNILAKLVGKKILITLSFFMMSITFFSVYFLGKFPVNNTLQAYLLVITYSLPLSFLSILPNAVLADIAEHDALTSGVRQEGMFFAARTLMQKFGQTFGVLVFAALTSFGKDVGDDLGIRISGLVGFALCIFAGSFFLKYNEKKILKETSELGG